MYMYIHSLIHVEMLPQAVLCDMDYFDYCISHNCPDCGYCCCSSIKALIISEFLLFIYTVGKVNSCEVDHICERV